MRIISKILIYITIIFNSPVIINGQEEYSRHLEIFSEANSLVQEERIDDAISLLNKHIELFQSDNITQFLFDWFKGVILYQTKKYTEAKPFLLKALSVLDANLDSFDSASINIYLPIYYYIADIEFQLEENSEFVVEHLEYAKEIYEMFGLTSDPLYLRIINDLNGFEYLSNTIEALDSFMARDYYNAIPKLHKLIMFFENNPQPNYEELAIWQKTLAMAYMYIGDYNNSEYLYISIIENLEKNNLQNEKIYRIILDALSVLYTQLQNYEKANLLNAQAKTLYEEALDFGDEYVGCLSNGATIQTELGHISVAKMMIDVAVRQAKINLSDTTTLSISKDQYNRFINNPSDFSMLNNNFFIQKRIIPYVTLLSSSSAVYSEIGYFSDAIRAIKESIRVSEEYGLKEALPYNNLGTLYLYKSKFPQSVEWFLKSYQLSKTPYESDEIGMNTALGLFLSRDSRSPAFCSEVSEKMRKNIQDMFAFMSSEERSNYWEHFENYLPVLNLIIYESDNFDVFGTIYDNILEAKGLLLRSTNAIRDAVLNSGNDNDIADFVRIGQLKQQLLNERDEVNRSSIEKEIESLDKKLTRHVSAYEDYMSSKTIHWEDVKNTLSINDAAIEFYNIPIVWGLDSIHTLNSEPRYCAVILKKGYEYPHIIPLCKESQLEELDKEDIYETDSIYNLIWKPLEQELEGIINVYFAADRELHKIGIEYAPLPNGDIIGDKYNLYRVSSTRVLAENKQDSKYETAVLYGGLNYDMGKEDFIAESRSGDYHTVSPSRAFTDDNLRYGVKYLPGTLKEVEDIAKGFVKEPRVITDATGTEESFKSLAGTSIDIIHLATHGFFWSDEDAKKRDYVTFLNPNNRATQSSEDKALMRSGLFFSGANVGLKGESLPDDVEDGVLTALELSNMNLGNVDMVVMSACESGLGETSGEGVFGLQRGFKLAGANTLLMSLWKVDDTATQILMTEFYKNYLSGKTKQESLRLAQKSLRDNPEYSDPQYWAAFILLDGLN